MRHDGGVERFTYRELDESAARVAAFLRTIGIGPGDRCAILGENSARWCAAYLAILQCGAIAVPFEERSLRRRIDRPGGPGDRAAIARCPARR